MTTPFFQEVNSKVSFTNIIYLNIKGVEEDNVKQIYFVSDRIKSKKGPGCKEVMTSCSCDECFATAAESFCMAYIV